MSTRLATPLKRINLYKIVKVKTEFLKLRKEFVMLGNTIKTSFLLIRALKIRKTSVLMPFATFQKNKFAIIVKIIWQLTKILIWVAGYA